MIKRNLLLSVLIYVPYFSQSQALLQPGIQLSYSHKDQLTNGFSIEPGIEFKTGKKKSQNYLRAGIGLTGMYYRNNQTFCFPHNSPNSIDTGKGGIKYIQMSSASHSFYLPLEFRYRVASFKRFQFAVFHGISFDYFFNGRYRHVYFETDSLCNNVSGPLTLRGNSFQARKTLNVCLINGLLFEYSLNKRLHLQLEAKLKLYAIELGPHQNLDKPEKSIGAGFKYDFY